MAETRTLVMTIVEVSWDDASGTLRIVPGRLEDKSAGGACVWVKTPITVGSRLRIQWRFEQFSGIAKYCRSDGTEYRVGIQRDEIYTPIPTRNVTNAAAPAAKAGDSSGTMSRIESLPKQPDSAAAEAPVATPERDSLRPPSFSTSLDRGTSALENKEIAARHPPVAQPKEFHARESIDNATAKPHSAELPSEQSAKRKDAGTERKRMQRNWLGLPHWHHNQDALGGNGNGNSSNDSEKESFAEPADTTEKTLVDSTQKPVFGFQAELLPIEDIYRDAGIMNPPKGYGIRKVVDMLHSEYIRSLPPEMKRAAVLMALDAAGIPLDQLQQDAKARRDVLDSYEAVQKKQLEAEWARKGEQNIQIQAELESVKASYMARISRNLDGIAREKATFGAWLAAKQQETQGILEAADLCSTSSASAPTGIPPSENSMAKAASAKPM
ncbi:MAG: hypothetical protein WB729_13555 [Candidatus Sulfotelmatobacter sp.]